MRYSLPLLASLFLLPAGCSSEELVFLGGPATLPDCADPPATNLDGSQWYDNGTVTILDDGCPETTVGAELQVCALDWEISQTGRDVELVVDNEYRIEGRLCGASLHLRGGWWLPVVDTEVGQCTYEEDSAEEVRIQPEGNVLAVTAQEMNGTLVVAGRCRASYEVTFRRK